MDDSRFSKKYKFQLTDIYAKHLAQYMGNKVLCKCITTDLHPLTQSRPLVSIIFNCQGPLVEYHRVSFCYDSLISLPPVYIVAFGTIGLPLHYADFEHTTLC